MMSENIYERVQKASHQEPMHPMGKVTPACPQQACNPQPNRQADGRMQEVMSSNPHGIFKVQSAEDISCTLSKRPTHQIVEVNERAQR